jgi:hypothetical protein
VGYKKKEFKTSEDLIKAMDEEDTFFAFRPIMEAELNIMVDTVMKASINDGTRYGHNLSQQRFILWIFQYVKDKEEDNIPAVFDGLLHPDLLHDLKKVPEGKNFAQQL